MSNLTFNFDKLYADNRKTHPSYNQSAIECDSCKVVLDSLIERDNLNSYASLGWWIEISTAYPACIYYFGAFENTKVAEAAMFGFIDDLLEEGARGMVAKVYFHAPVKLTIDLTGLQDRNESSQSHLLPGVHIL